MFPSRVIIIYTKMAFEVRIIVCERVALQEAPATLEAPKFECPNGASRDLCYAWTCASALWIPRALAPLFSRTV